MSLSLRRKENKGVALILVILLMTTILFLALYFLNFTATEKKIAKSQSWGAKTYYLAEAGIAEMVWRLKNNAVYANNFETNPGWTESFSRNNPFGANSGSYTVSITNSELAHGEIVATGSINIEGDKNSQRIIKTYVYKAVSNGADLNIGDSGIFADNVLDITLSKVNVYSGSIHANNNIDIRGLDTVVNVDNDIRAVGEYNESFAATVWAGGNIYDNHSHPPQPLTLNLPTVDFNSTDLGSLKNRADIIYTENEFQNLMDSSGSSLTLNNPITYVTGDIVFKGDPAMTINGLLVAEGSIIVGKTTWVFIFPFCNYGYASLDINHASGTPSGLISLDDIKIDFCASVSNIEGVVYASDTVSIINFSNNTDITGGFFARNISIFSIWQPIDFTFNEGIINDTLGSTEFSPVITVEHWEEEY